MTMKTLVVRYLPAGEYSKTKQILDAFLDSLEDSAVETLDLAEAPPEVFTPARFTAYVVRNFQGKPLDAAQAAELAPADALVEQVKRADRIILAYPMHNFGLPAAVKAWFDAIIQAGVTFTYGANGPMGMLDGKRAVVLTSSGSRYDGDGASLDHSTPLSRQLLNFIGIADVEIIAAEGTALGPEAAEASISGAVEHARALAGTWNQVSRELVSA